MVGLVWTVDVVGVSGSMTLTLDGTARRGGFELEVAVAVPSGTVMGVLGPNGSGKTTLLRVLSGLTPLESGRLAIGDHVLDEPATGTFVPPDVRPVGLVFQNYRLFPHLSVLDNIAFAPRCSGASRSQARARAREWVRRFDLGELAHRRPDEISGGQAQRVALARALAAQPHVMLFDEPLAALDSRARLEVRTQLREYLRDVSGPVVMVTHDPVEAMVVADELLVIEGGRVVQRGRPADVARRPATDYVALLVRINLYAGAVDGDRVTLDEGGSLAVSPRRDTAVSAGQPDLGETVEPSSEQGRRMLVAVRPEAITVHTERPVHSSSRNVWPGTVESLEGIRDRIRVQVTGRPSALVDVTAAAVADLDLRPGTAVWLSAKATETLAYADPARSAAPAYREERRRGST